VKLFRYRKPSAKTLLGVTRAKKRAKKALGITAAMKPARTAKNLERRAKRASGYYAANRIAKGKAPTPLGCGIPVLLFIAVASILFTGR